MKTRLLTLLMALAIGPLTAFAGDTPEFIRFAPGKGVGHGALQISQVTYVSEKTDVKVVLYGVVHIADKAYYEAVQKDLDSYTAVLYEGVGKPKDPKTVVKKPSEGMASLGQMQKDMGELLGLTFQKDGINYKAKNLVHADISYEEMMKRTGGDMSKAMPGMMNPEMLKQIGPMLKGFMAMGKQFMAGNPAMQNRLKHQFANQMIGQLDTAITGEAKQFIVIDRNKIAMKVLDREVAKRKTGTLCLFYGAAHNKDFHERLVKRGFKAVKTEWKNAWLIGDGPLKKDSTVAKTEPAKPAETKPAAKKLELKKGKRYYE